MAVLPKGGILRMIQWFAKTRFLFRRYLLGGDCLARNPPPPAAQRMLVVGHRGASAVRPENSRAAFVWAFDHGIKGIELDVHRTSDDKVVVNHDLTLRRTCPDRQRRHCTDLLDTPIHHLRMDEICKVPNGFCEDKLQYPMSLHDALHLVPEGGVILVEIKRETDTPEHKTFELVAKVVQGYKGGADIRFISFCWDGLALLKKHCPDRRCYAITVALPFKPGGLNSLKQQIDRSVKMGLDGIDVNADSAAISKDICNYAHSRGQEVYVWRGPTETESNHLWSTMASIGIDGFTSDIPEEILVWQAAIPLAAGCKADEGLIAG